MKTDKTKLLQDIKAMKEKLASMEKELSKPEIFKHFPSKDDEYYFYSPAGSIICNDASNDSLKINVFKTREEAQKACIRAVALEKIKRKIIELQGDWKPDWTKENEKKYCIQYSHYKSWFRHDCWCTTQSDTTIPFIKNEKIVKTIIEEMEDELKLIFDLS